MTDRPCPSCGNDVASHQTVCPACRTPVSSEAGPVGSAGSSSGIVIGAPPPRQTRPRPGATPVAPPDTGSPEVAPPVAGRDEPLAPESPALAPPAIDPSADLADPTFLDPRAGVEAPAPGGLDDPTRINPSVGAPTPDTRRPNSSRGHTSPPDATWLGLDDATRLGPAHTSGTPAAPAFWSPSPTGDGGPGASGYDPLIGAGGRGPSAGTLGVPGARTLDERGNLPGGLLALLAGALAVAGVFLPWVEITDTTVSGWSASQDAKGVLALAGIATVSGALLVGGARSLVLRIGLAAVALALAALTVVEILSVGGLEGDASMGPGLILVPVGAAVAAVGALVTRHKRFR